MLINVCKGFTNNMNHKMILFCLHHQHKTYEAETLITKTIWLHSKTKFYSMDFVCVCALSSVLARQSDDWDCEIDVRKKTSLRPVGSTKQQLFQLHPKACWVSGKLKNWSAVEEMHAVSGGLRAWKPANTAENLMMLMCLFLLLIIFFRNNVKNK